MLKLRNKTRAASKVGYLVKAVRGGFEYAGAGDIPVGVVTEIVPAGEVCNIQTEGRTRVYAAQTITAGVQLRTTVEDEGGISGQVYNIGDEETYITIGHAITHGRGLIEASLNISTISGGGAGGGLPAGGVAGDILTKLSAVDQDAAWATPSYDNYGGWLFRPAGAGDPTQEELITSGKPISIIGGTGIGTAWTGGNTLTITNTLVAGSMDYWNLQVDGGASSAIANAGIVNFESGAGISLAKIDSGGVRGVAITSTIPAITINNQGDNRIVTATGTTDSLYAESNLTYNGSYLGIGDGSTSMRIVPTANTDGFPLFSDVGTELPFISHATGAGKRAVTLGVADDSTIPIWLYMYEGNLPTSAYMTFGTNTTERMRITANGTLCVGTTTSRGIITLDQSLTNYSGRGVISEDTGYTGIKFYDQSAGNLSIFNKQGGSSYGNIYFDTGLGPTTKMTVHNDGGVGIGTTNPSYNLHIQSDAVGGAALMIQSINDAGIILDADTDNITESHNPYIVFRQDAAALQGTIGLTTGAADAAGNSCTGVLENSFLMHSLHGSYPMQFATNGAARMTIVPGGNVGVNTTSPDQLLEVSDTTGATIRINSTKSGTWIEDEEFGRLEFYGNDVSSIGPAVRAYIRAVSNSTYGVQTNLEFAVSNGTDPAAVAMTIFRNGYIGINDDSPQYQLDINGDFRVTNYAYFNSNIFQGDSDSHYFGDDNDGRIWHDGVSFNFRSTLHGGTVVFQGEDDSGVLKTMISYDPNTAVYLRYDGSVKFETTNTGVKVTGDVIATGEVESYDTSDINLKDNIENLDIRYISDMMLNSRLISYDHKIKNKREIGWIAQEIQSFLPENVKKDGNGNLMIHYGKMGVALAAVDRVQQDEINELKSEVRELKRKLSKY